MDNPREEDKMINETEKSYLAGVIDSDGCIQLSKNTNCRTYKAIVTITQRDIALIEWIYQRFEGHLYIDAVKRNKSFKKQNAYFRLSFFNTNAVDLLTQLSPYLVAKKQQALCVIHAHQMTRNCIKGKWNSLPDDVLEFQKEMHIKIKNLNSPATTERDGSLTKEMRQSELTEMIKRQSGNRSIPTALLN